MKIRNLKLHPLLKREEKKFNYPDVDKKRIMITGSRGSIGSRVLVILNKLGAKTLGFDIIDGFDITQIKQLEKSIRNFHPDIIIHLAAHKFATKAEFAPSQVTRLNIDGTYYLCSTALKYKVPKVIVASTCKAIQPETVYGASKLIAERITLNAGFSVGRFFNVVESAGNVFEIWNRQKQKGKPLPVTPCRRYFISVNEAVSFIIYIINQESGRYAPFPGNPIMIKEMVKRFAPGYPTKLVPARRGDRLIEPLVGEHESYKLLENKLMIINNPHDVVTAANEELEPLLIVKLGE